MPAVEPRMHASLPRDLRRRFRQALVWDELTFKSWLIARVNQYLSEVAQKQEEEREDARTP